MLKFVKYNDPIQINLSKKCKKLDQFWSQYYCVFMQKIKSTFWSKLSINHLVLHWKWMTFREALLLIYIPAMNVIWHGQILIHSKQDKVTPVWDCCKWYLCSRNDNRQDLFGKTVMTKNKIFCNILTSVWVPRIPNADWNLHFQHFWW